MSKPKVAFFDFASCEGCQLAILNCEDILIQLLDLVEIVEFREAMSEKSDHYDVSFIEGSINRYEDAERLIKIRDKSSFIVALGACACNGNVQARSNFYSPAKNLDAVYGAEDRKRVQSDPVHKELWRHTRVQQVDEIVKVDFYLRGCPIVQDEFVELVKSLIFGKVYSIPSNPVCVECKRNENECVFDRGDACMGPVTWGGCNSVCVNGGWVCDGCRGILPDANIRAHAEVMKEKGFDIDSILNKYRLHLSGEDISQGILP